MSPHTVKRLLSPQVGGMISALMDGDRTLVAIVRIPDRLSLVWGCSGLRWGVHQLSVVLGHAEGRLVGVHRTAQDSTGHGDFLKRSPLRVESCAACGTALVNILDRRKRHEWLRGMPHCLGRDRNVLTVLSTPAGCSVESC